MTKAYDSYEFQDVYEQGTNGQYALEATGSWRPKMTGQIIPNWRNEFYGDESYKEYSMLPQKNIIDDFFRTALNYTNSVSATGGNDKMNARFSFTDTRNQGILPNESMNKQNYNLNVIYIFTLDRAGNGETLKVQKLNNQELKNIQSISFLASGEKVKWTQDESGLYITTPAAPVGEYAYAFKVTMQ